MPSLGEIFAAADAALATAVAEPGGSEMDRFRALRPVMDSFTQIASEVLAGRARWSEARAWALGAAPRFVQARPALAAWESVAYDTYQHGGEEEGNRALAWRSQRALAEALFAGTPAAAVLAAENDAELDAEMAAEAERIALDAPDWVPRSHTWWRWTERRLARPIVPEVSFEEPAPGPMKRNPTMPPAARAAIVQRLARESDHAGALPDPLPLDRVLMPVDRAKRTTEQLRIKAGQDAQGYFLDFYKVDARDQASFHGRIRDDGSAQPLENIEGQHGRRASADPAETERERQRVIANNERAREILRTKGFL